MSEVEVSMDGLNGTNPKERKVLLLAKIGAPKVREVQLSMSVEERTIRLGDGKVRMLWCREPMEDMAVAGFVNPLFHVDFAPGEEEAARTRVKKSFLEYWCGPTLYPNHPVKFVKMQPSSM